MRLPVFFPALILTVFASAQSELPVIRQGSVPISPSGRLYISTEGGLILKGQPGATRVAYALRSSAKNTTAVWNARGDAISLQVIAFGQPDAVQLAVTVPAGLSQVTLDTKGGSLTVSDLNGEVHVSTLAGRVEADRLGGDLELRSGGGEIRIGKVAGSIRCFSGAGGIRVESTGRESWFQTAGGDILIGQAGGTVHATSGGGSIRLERGAADVFASTTGGAIQVGQAAGLVTADTNGGWIQVNGSKGAQCQADAGTIHLRNPVGGSVRATTSVGNILAELLSPTRFEDGLLSTGAGDITVFLSSNVPVTVQARNESAGGNRRIISEFPEIRVRYSRAPHAAPMFAEGALNGGGPILRIYAAGGTIYLRRQN